MQKPEPLLYAGEQLDQVAGFPTLYNFFPADPKKPLVVFIPGNLHNGRIAYGGHQSYQERDFLAYWLNSHGHGLLAISYPLESNPEVMPASAPQFRISDWGKQAAEVTHSTIKKYGLSNQVVLTAWSMGGRIVIPYNAAAKSLGLDVVLFVPLAATPGIHGLRVQREYNPTAAGYASFTSPFQWFILQLQEQREKWNGGDIIIPDDIYMREYCGHTPVGLSGSHLAYDRDNNSFVEDPWTSTEDAAIEQAQHCPMIAALTGTSPLDARHVIGDQAAWGFLLGRRFLYEIDSHSLKKVITGGKWDDLNKMIQSALRDIVSSIPGNHFFFVGEFGARETAASIVRQLEKVTAFRREFEALLNS